MFRKRALFAVGPPRDPRKCPSLPQVPPEGCGPSAWWPPRSSPLHTSSLHTSHLHTSRFHTSSLHTSSVHTSSCARFLQPPGGGPVVRRLREMRMHVLAFPTRCGPWATRCQAPHQWGCPGQEWRHRPAVDRVRPLLARGSSQVKSSRPLLARGRLFFAFFVIKLRNSLRFRSIRSNSIQIGTNCIFFASV